MLLANRSSSARQMRALRADRISSSRLKASSPLRKDFSSQTLAAAALSMQVRMGTAEQMELALLSSK
jgi:hypothetical protein